MRRAVMLVVCAACGSRAPAAGESTGKASSTGSTSTGTTTSGTTTSGADTSSSSSDTSTTGGESSSGSGGEGTVIALRRITDQNRHYVEMYGGWGPHLRGIMRDADDREWFVLDRGEDVLHNRSIVYLRRDGETWSEVATQDHTGGVQQNAASLLQAGVINTYAIDVASHWLTRCTFDTASATPTGCNAIYIGGLYSTPVNANYVGAALSPDPAHLVWFTVVGDAGGAGQFVYTYDYGGGWNGPVVTDLPGFNDIGYVFAAFAGPSHAMLVGQTFAGVYPSGTYDAVLVEFDFGQPAQFTVLAAEDGVDVRTGADIWIDPDSGAVHVIAETDAGLAYWFRPPGEAWADHLVAREIVSDTFRARFVSPAGGPLALARGSASDGGLELRIAATPPDMPAVWADAEAVAIPIPARGFDAPSAIYVEGSSYQDTPPAALQLAACGQYQVGDAEIWQARLE